jgi:REP element-mobilizing transposase RayT
VDAGVPPAVRSTSLNSMRIDRFYRRTLPHWRKQAATYFVTWRIARGQKELSGEERTVVMNAIRHFDGNRYDLDVFVVMNDHVHVILNVKENQSPRIHNWLLEILQRPQDPKDSRRVGLAVAGRVFRSGGPG